MGLFSTIGGFLGGPGGSAVGAAADIGVGFIGGNREKRAIDEAARNESLSLGENIDATNALSERTLARTEPLISSGQSSTTRIQDILSGNARHDPTAGEVFATERAQEGVDRLAAGNKQLFSGKRIEDFAGATAEVGSRFRQQELNNLFNQQGAGLQATGLAQSGDFNSTAEGNRLRELLGGVQSSRTLGKAGVDTSNIKNIASSFSGLLESLKPLQGVG